MWTESPVRNGETNTASLPEQARLRKERRRRRRRALTTVLLILAGTAGIAWWMYDTTGGDLLRASAAAGLWGLFLVVLAIYRSHRRTMRAFNSPLRPSPAKAAAAPPAPAPPPPAAPPLAPPLPEPPPSVPAAEESARGRDRRRPSRLPSRHRVSIATALLIGAVTLALVASGLAIVLAGRPGAATPAGGGVAATADPGPTGFAEQVIGAWLRAGEDRLGELQPLMAGPVNLAGVPSGSFDATHISALSTTPLGANYWSVLVAADRVQRIGKPDTRQVHWEPDGTHYYRVGISGANGRYLATGLPGEVARPKPPTAPGLAVTSQADADLSDPRTDTLERFFDAFLAGNGELSRYVLPGVPARPLDEPNRYTDSQVRSVGFDDPQARSRVTAEVTVAATNNAGNLQVLAYNLTLVNQDGRWYVKALDGAAALAP